MRQAQEDAELQERQGKVKHVCVKCVEGVGILSQPAARLDPPLAATRVTCPPLPSLYRSCTRGGRTAPARRDAPPLSHLHATPLPTLPFSCSCTH